MESLKVYGYVIVLLVKFFGCVGFMGFISVVIED